MSVRTGVILALVAAFLIGCSVGAIGGFATAGFVARRFAAHGRAGGGGPGPRPLLGMLERRLDLTDEQVERLEVIVERSHVRMNVVRDSTHAELERVLTPEQRRRWRRMEERLLRLGPGRGRGRRLGHGDPGPDPDGPPPGP